jgi:DNA-binding MarR family transcriptional regulator
MQRKHLSADDARPGELHFAGLDLLLGYRLRRAQGAVHRAFVQAVAGLNLTQKQTAVLWLAAGNPGVSQSAIAAALAMDRATTMAVVDRLSERRLLRRQKSRTDRRRQEILITPSGRRTLERLRVRIADQETRTRALFKRAELRTLMDLLERLQQSGPPPAARRRR